MDTPPLRLEWRDPAELAENPRNWRTHPAGQVAALTDVLAEVGWAGACLYNERTGRLIDGHARRKVALEQGSQKVPVLVGSWDEAQERKILATLDPLAALAEADAPKLDALLREIDTGSAAIQTMLADLAAAHPAGPALPEPGGDGDEFDATPEESGPTRTQSGDLWVLRGNGLEHRLLVGDCTVAENVERLMGGEKAAVVVTDPPYGIDYQNHAPGRERSNRSFQVENDKTQEVGKKALVMCADLPCLAFASPMFPWPGDWKQHLVWDKGNSVGVGGDPETYWRMSWELIQVARTKKLNGTRDPSVLSYSVGSASYADHPTQKPVALIEYLIGKVSQPSDIIYDPFLGSGTTLIAAHRLGRRCFGCEIEPRYGDVILKRAEAEGLACVKAA